MHRSTAHNTARSFSIKSAVGRLGILPAVASIGLLSLSFCGTASADTLSPGSALTISFGVAPNTSDLFIFGSGYGFTATGSPMVTTQLYNGNTLLGQITVPVQSYSGESYFGDYFEKAGSPFSYGPPAVVDFSSINGGTTHGKLVVTVTDGDISFNPNWYLRDALSCGAGCYQPRSNVSITDMEIGSAGPTPTPEPASAGLAGMAIAASGLLLLRRKTASAKN